MPTMTMPWREAMEHALYGDGGFFTGGGAGPAAHFRTSVHVSTAFAAALVRLAHDCGLRTVVDVGAGRAELLAAVAGIDPALRLVAVERAARPAGLPDEVHWCDRVPPEVEAALVVANECLDNVPLDVVQLHRGKLRVLLVDPVTGAESPGPEATADDLAWLARWWPPAGAAEEAEGRRFEVGHPRDRTWGEVVAAVHDGVAVAVDYGHLRGSRPAHPTLAGYRGGRRVDPVPDGTCDVTAAVALDAVAAAGMAAGATSTVLTTQRAALQALLAAPGTTPYDAARRDPAAALDALRRAGEWAELVDPDGLGGFCWLMQGIGVDLPGAVRAAAPFDG